MDIDILKPSTGYLSVERPSSSKGSPERQSSGDITPSQAYAEPVSEGEEDEVMDMAPAKDEGGRTGLSQQDAAAAIAFREKSLKERDDSSWQGVGSPARNGIEQGVAAEDEETDESTPFLQAPRSPRAQPEPHYKNLSIDPLAPSSTFDKTLRERLQGAATDGNGERGASTREAKGINEDELPEDDRLLVRDWIAPSGKKIAVPVRVEPKVYFANERTFLVNILHCVFSFDTESRFFRNGCISRYSSEPLPQHYSTLFPLKIQRDSSAQRCSRSQLYLLSPMRLLSSCIVLFASAPGVQRAFTMTSMAQQSCAWFFSWPWRQILECECQSGGE